MDTRPYIEYFLDKDVEEKFAQLYYEGANIKDLSMIFNLSKKKVRNLIKILNLQRINGIKSPEKLFKKGQMSYALGFLFSKVGMYRHSQFPKYEIFYQEEHKEIMEWILGELGYVGKPYYDTSNGRYTVHPNSIRFIEILTYLGMSVHGMPTKFPINQKGKDAIEFIRGYIDGGGGIINTKIGYIIIKGSKGFLGSCLKFIGLQGKVNVVSQQNAKDIKDKQIRVRVTKSLYILDKLYYDGCITTNKSHERVKEFREKFGYG